MVYVTGSRPKSPSKNRLLEEKLTGKTEKFRRNAACIRAIRDATEVSKAHNEALEVLEVAEDIIKALRIGYATKNGGKKPPRNERQLAKQSVKSPISEQSETLRLFQDTTDAQKIFEDILEVTEVVKDIINTAKERKTSSKTKKNVTKIRDPVENFVKTLPVSEPSEMLRRLQRLTTKPLRS